MTNLAGLSLVLCSRLKNLENYKTYEIPCFECKDCKSGFQGSCEDMELYVYEINLKELLHFQKRRGPFIEAKNLEDSLIISVNDVSDSEEINSVETVVICVSKKTGERNWGIVMKENVGWPTDTIIIF